LQYVRAFDIWTMPSLAEGLGLALLEGMSGHLPVIASSVPAMLPLIQGAGGLAVPPGDVNALTSALADYLRLSDQELQERGERAYAYLCASHDIESFRQQYLRLVDESLETSLTDRHEQKSRTSHRHHRLL
jgi:glycosyltransferase involved in cell wall biosynthesis